MHFGFDREILIENIPRDYFQRTETRFIILPFFYFFRIRIFNSYTPSEDDDLFAIVVRSTHAVRLVENPRARHRTKLHYKYNTSKYYRRLLYNRFKSS